MWKVIFDTNSPIQKLIILAVSMVGWDGVYGCMKKFFNQFVDFQVQKLQSKAVHDLQDLHRTKKEARL